MNSSVKQSQKDGASVEDISAGLSVSVVKNALYKVIRAVSPKELGEHIVVQGGTFYNDAVLRAFEQEIGAPVIRPAIAGLMGAYGAALHVMELPRQSSAAHPRGARLPSGMSRAARVCGGCANHCRLTINRFCGRRKVHLAATSCQRALGGKAGSELPDLHEWKRQYLQKPAGRFPERAAQSASRWRFLPMNWRRCWHGLFTSLGFEVALLRAVQPRDL